MRPAKLRLKFANNCFADGFIRAFDIFGAQSHSDELMDDFEIDYHTGNSISESWNYAFKKFENAVIKYGKRKH